ncbi:DUF2357 domain-containing protein [Bacillus sp. BGMRC 2118]|nr:DUF2357 domain-containing protein [Bacillus sp. BGMRC 2118]
MTTLPLSGLAKEDVELVKIETVDFSLVIKGKPYHERYVGLQQYHSMQFFDEMEFRVIGDCEDLKVFDVNSKSLVEPSKHRPIFFENGVYQVMISPKGEKELSFYHEHPSLRKAVDRVSIGNSYVLLGNLHFQSEIGFTSFEVRNNEETLLEVTLEIFPTKLNYKDDYQNLLNEVNDEIYNLAFHFLKKTYLSAKTKLEGNPSPVEFFRLISYYFDSFIKSIEQIERQPHHKLEKSHEVVRGDRIKNLDSKSRNYLIKNSRLLQPVDHGIKIGTKQYLPIKGLTAKKEITYVTHENKFVKLMMTRLLMKLEDLYNRYVNLKSWGEQTVNEEIRQLIEGMKNKLHKKLGLPFWREMPMPDQVFSSLVLQLAPGYRDAYQIYLTVSKGLTLHSSIHKMSVKDVATLYEYWTYLKLGQILGRKYTLVSQDIIKVNRDGLFVNLDANRQAKRVYKHPITNEKITLTYQKRENKLPTITQVPDTMLSIEKKGDTYTYNYVFDAKYRIDFATEGSYYGRKYSSPGPMEDDINTMHRYRDSIVAEQSGPYERTSFGAYVLFPWGDEQLYLDHHFYKSIDKVNIGGFPFLPNATNLVERFVENLIEKSSEELQEEGILPIGSLEKWKETIEDKVLVGTVSSLTQYQTCIQKKQYRIPVSLLKSGWQEAKYVALYLTKDVGTRNGVTNYGKIEILQVNEEDILLHIDVWKELKEPIKPVNYGIANYMITTIQNLKMAKELPELFMKTDDERLVWQMLRRVSDTINFTLDSTYLDSARSINELKIKNVTLRFNKVDNTVDIISKVNKFTKSIGELRSNPSSVFKMILGELDGKQEM